MSSLLVQTLPIPPLAFLSFLSPWLLAGLLILPAIWWLLKVTPPVPKHISFPPTWILKGLTSAKKSPAHTPLWLLVLRMAIAASVIFALAAPLLFGDNTTLPGKKELVLVIDNGWASGDNWALRKEKLLGLIEQARQNNRPVLVLPTVQQAKAIGSLQAISANDASRYAASLMPHPAMTQRVRLIKQLTPFFKAHPKAGVVWLSNGLAEKKTGSEGFAKALGNIVPGHELQVILPSNENYPLGLHVQSTQKGQLQATVFSAGLTAHSGLIIAQNNKGQALGEQPFSVAKGETSSKVTFTLPLELRNQISRLTIRQSRHAGAVYLLDATARWRRIGLLSGESADLSQPLLSPLYYIEKAITGFSEIHHSKGEGGKNRFTEILKQKLSALVLADIGKLDEKASAKIETWVRQGGVLIRFAGVHMEQGSDHLLPVPLRNGGRTLGGALSWSTPQKLAQFEKDSPFFGLKAPKDITVTRQVLADPALLRDDVQIWARLQDGTPLVTARPDEKGWIILFHVTANTDWSNLSHSELFINMLKRSIMIAGGNEGLIADSSPNSESYNSAALKPLKVLDGFGKLSPPPATAEPLEGASEKARPDFNHPPGFYGRPGTIRSLNLMDKTSTITPIQDLASSVRKGHYKASTAISLVPFFFMLAFLLLLADTVLTYLMMNGREMTISKMTDKLTGLTSKLRQKGRTNSITLLTGAVLSALLSQFLAAPLIPSAHAQKTAAQKPAVQKPVKASPRTEAFARKSLTATRFAYVITGNSKVDNISRQGLAGLSFVTKSRTALEPGDPVGVNIAQDDLSFFPILYWPVLSNAPVPSAKALARIDHYMKHGGMIVFDQQKQVSSFSGFGADPTSKSLRRILGRLDIPPLEPVPQNHVLTRSFYLLQDFPGRWAGGKLWTEAGGAGKKTSLNKARTADGVSSILITSNDLASAWALDENRRPLYPVVPGGERQREMAYRTGINIAMYALTGNYKADQVHTPALLERIGQ